MIKNSSIGLQRSNNSSLLNRSNAVQERPVASGRCVTSLIVFLVVIILIEQKRTRGPRALLDRFRATIPIYTDADFNAADLESDEERRAGQGRNSISDVVMRQLGLSQESTNQSTTLA